MLLTREAILGADDLKSVVVTVGEWGGDVTVRGMTGAQRDAFMAANRTKAGEFDPTNYRAKLVARCVVDEAGKPMFTEADIEALSGKSSAALDRVFNVADKLSSTSAEAVKEAEKN